MAEEIPRDGKLSNDALVRTIERYRSRDATELILACCWFDLMSRFLEATGIELG